MLKTWLWPVEPKGNDAVLENDWLTEPGGTVSIIGKLLRKVSFKHRFAHEAYIAEHVSAQLVPLLTMVGKACKFPFDSSQTDVQTRQMLGFVTAACDTMSQALGGEPGGNGATNAALRCYNELCGPDRTMALLQRGFELQEARDQAFWHACDSGKTWIIAVGKSDFHTASMITALLFAAES